MKFIEEYYQVTGRDRDEDIAGWMKAMIESDISDLNAKDRIWLVEKCQISDIYEIPQWVRDEAAGIKREVEPANPLQKVSHMLTNNQNFKESFYRYLKSAEEDAFIKALEELPPEEMAEVRAAAAPSA